MSTHVSKKCIKAFTRMDDIARDVSQAHNQYVVPADSHRFPWHALDSDIQEQILRDAPPYSSRYFTNPGGGFNWAGLERGVRAQIRRHLRDITRARVDIHGPDWEDWPAPYQIRNPSNIRHLPTSFTLSVERIRNSVLDAAPLLTVTFHHYLEQEKFLRSERNERGRAYVNQFQALSASQLESLCAQMDRTTCWSNVHTIRVIRWHVGEFFEYTLEFVSTDEHGNEVTSTLDAIEINPSRIEFLESRFLERLGLRRYDVHLATARRRWLTLCDCISYPSHTDAVEWRLPHTAVE